MTSRKVRFDSQKRDAIQPPPKPQLMRQETHSGELTDEDGDIIEREADLQARTATPRRKGTPTPKHAQMGRYRETLEALHKEKTTVIHMSR